MSSPKILIIDDEESIIKFVKHSLEANAYQVISAASGNEGIQRIIERKPDLVILDYGLPDISGLDVLRKIREWTKTPVIFLTVRNSDEDKVLALDSGADDYLTKPFSVSELLARIRVALRHAALPVDLPVFKTGPIEVDRAARLIRVNDKEVKMSATEYALVSLLVSHAGKVVPQRVVLQEVWGPNSVEHTHYLRVYFGQIRKKFEAIFPGAGEYIKTEAGIGYRIIVE